MSSGKLIAIEGIDGSGKTDFTQALTQSLQQAGIPTLSAFEPGGTDLAMRLRDILKSGQAGDDPWVQALLFNAARRSLLQTVVLPALQAGTWVILDRFLDSTLVYQSSPECHAEELLQLHALAQGNLQPHAKILLDVSPSIAMQRTAHRGDLDYFDNNTLEHYQTLRHRFWHLVETQNDNAWIVINADRPLVESLTETMQHLRWRFSELNQPEIA